MKYETCCFTGHRKLPPEELPELRRKLELEFLRLAEQGVCYFGAGGALGFDTLAAETVLSLRQQHPRLRLIMVLPYPSQSESWNRVDVTTYEAILARADKIVYTAQRYFPGCYHKRNRHLAVNSSYCICHVRKASGGAWQTLQIAKGLGHTVIEL